MTDHIEEHWPLYAAGILILVLLLGLWALVWADKARQRATAYCQDRGMVRVETPAGERCAPLWALERIAR
jgi:hypothetical protein